MIHSMTGYSVAARELPFGVLTVELRSVNHRYLEVQLRLPDDLRAIEPALRELLQARVGRGKVECRVAFAATSAGGKSLQINEELARQLQAAESKLRTMLAGATQLTIADVMRWPGVLVVDPLPLEALQAACRKLVEEVIVEFDAARAREGAKLAALLLERAAAVEAIVAKTAPRLPQAVEAYRQRLTARLREALGSGEEERIRQETAVFATKVDVDEELSRLTAHVAELRLTLKNGGVVGKKLDFLMQELNREANTLASKSVDIEVTRAALDLKLLIEQMREQIQNIE
jgi:uncharacterized protein (TIGR00255 family)